MTRRARILTLNTGRNQGDYDRRIANIIAGLRSARADIILLQECFADDAGEADAAQTIATELGMNYVAHGARRKPRAWRGREVMSEVKLAVLAREPIEAASVHDLSALPADGQRVAQLVQLPVAGQMCALVNTHLTYLTDPAGVALRQTQLREVFALFASAERPLKIAGGDFNATLNSIEFVGASAGLSIDIGPLAPEAFPPTLLGGLGYAADPPRAVDHVLLLAATGARIVERETLLTSTEEESLASDHAAVCVTLEIA